MLRRIAIPLILIVAILAASSGLLRLRFDTDILSMLPPELPEVKGLKAFHEAFSRDNEPAGDRAGTTSPKALRSC